MEDVKKEVIELSYCVVSSSEMATVKDALSDDENKKEFNDNINTAINDISKKLQTGIDHTSDFYIISLPECIDDITLLSQFAS